MERARHDHAAPRRRILLLVGGAFSVVDRTGAFRHGVEWLARRLHHPAELIIPISCVLFATAGALEGMWEEIVALMPVLLLLRSAP